jgi:hypothetical protein
MRDILQSRVNGWAISDLIRARICESIRADESLAYVENHSFNCPRINTAPIVARSRPNRDPNVELAAGYTASWIESLFFAELALAPEAAVFSEDLDNSVRLLRGGVHRLGTLLSRGSQ